MKMCLLETDIFFICVRDCSQTLLDILQKKTSFTWIRRVSLFFYVPAFRNCYEQALKSTAPSCYYFFYNWKHTTNSFWRRRRTRIWSSNCNHFMETEYSLLRWKRSVAGHIHTVGRTLSTFSQITLFLILSYCLHLCVKISVFPSTFPYKILKAFVT